MERARQAVSDFVSKDGKHRTSYDENVERAVTEEHVRPHQHEEVTTALDKEVHQDHHHMIVQPIEHRETLPEKHTHNVMPVEHRTFEHGNVKDVEATLAREKAKYMDSSVTHETTHSTSAAPVVTGEHVHHHVHEHIQPMVHKEVHAPQVVHTTIPIHETHHAEAVHHGTTTLPTKTLEEYTSSHGTLEGRGVTQLTEFDGCPKPYNENLQGERTAADKDLHLHSHGTHGHSHTHTHKPTLQESAATTAYTETSPTSATTGTTGTMGTMGTTAASRDSGVGMTGEPHIEKRASLKDRLNPFKDSDHDGKKGFMD